MTLDTTYGTLKKRISDLLFEYSSDADTVFLADGDKALVESKLPDAVNSALLQMYESLPIGNRRAVQRLQHTKEIAYSKGFPDDKGAYAELYIPACSVVVYFKYFGKGLIVFADENDEDVYTVSCQGSESLTEMRQSVMLPKEGVYRVYAVDGLTVKDFNVYEANSLTKTSYCCGRGRACFELPEMFGAFICVIADGRAVDKRSIEISGNCAYISESECAGLDSLVVHYKKCAETVTQSTPDSFTFDLMPLEFEALICLAASFVCREQDAGKHTLLVYRYNDLCEGLRSTASSVGGRNGFYRQKRKMGW